MKKIIFVFALSWCCFFTITAQDLAAVDSDLSVEATFEADQETNVDFQEVLRLADFYRGGHVPGIAWDLEVQNIERGKIKNEITFLIEAKTVETKLYAMVNFLKPRKYDGQKLLVRENNMWFVKPGLRRPVAISSRQRLSGSAANADVASANYLNEYDIVVNEEDTFNGTDCWVLELEAKSNLVSYPRIKYWVAKKGNLGLQAEFYGKSKKLIKVAHFEYDNTFNYEGEDHSFVSKVIIFDKINEEDKTTLMLDNIRVKKYNTSKFQKGRMMD